MAEMAEVIAFLIEHFQDFETCPPIDDLGKLLEDVGFGDAEINNALILLESLGQEQTATREPYRSDAMRIYTHEELTMLPSDVFGLLHFLEKEEVINIEQREFILQALLLMPLEDINVDMAKIFTLLVLWVHKAKLPVLIGDDLMMALHGKVMMH